MAPGLQYTAHLSRLSVAVALACVGIRGAYASYTLIDDDLLPTAVVEARQAAPTPTEQYNIPFAKNATALGPLGRRSIDQLIPSLQGATITIVGRPDALPGAMAYSADKTATIPLALARANTLRQYLLRQGIPVANIVTAPDDTPNPQTSGSIYPSQLVVTRGNHRPHVHDPNLYTLGRAALTPNLTVTSIFPPAQPTSAATLPASPPGPVGQSSISLDRDRLIQFINASVLNGRMDANVALALMSRLLTNEHSSANANTRPPAPAPVVVVAPPLLGQHVAPAPIAPAPLFVATPALVRRDSWVLNKALTLRDNVDAWSKQAGWNPSQWDASNYYQVTVSTTIEGDFPDVLRQVADTTGLNICARKREKYVRVTDAGISCEK